MSYLPAVSVPHEDRAGFRQAGESSVIGYPEHCPSDLSRGADRYLLHLPQLRERVHGCQISEGQSVSICLNSRKIYCSDLDHVELRIGR